MEWSIKSFSKCCAVSGVPFLEGDEILCFICMNLSGEIERFDVLKGNISDFVPQGRILGQWKKVFSKENSHKTEEIQKIFHYEEFFFSLFDGEKSREKEILKQLFAFLLEKRRILRAFSKKNGKNQKFIHIKTKKEFIVSLEDFFPEDLTSLENVFGMLV